ncbi:alpha/beta hydrolase [Streptomyces sp. NPDC093546]|uniref:alpha/beta hydrolase n=1 Tax=Streptomyces sp. NPDC093546 TaxID=3366040 RepID=UPI0037F67956
MPTPTRARAHRRTAVLAVASAATAAAVLLAAGCSDGGKDGGTPDQPTDLAVQELEWSACRAPSAEEGSGTAPSPLPGGGRWECAFMEAPLDYGDVEGDTIELALIRARATDPARRIGSLIFNFGGPGGSGITALPSFAKEFEELRTRYDLVSFDPRGVGRSEGVECQDDRELDAFLSLDASPDDAREEEAYQKGLKDFAAACEENSGHLLPHVGTVDAARDLDLIRAVLGDDKLHYFGISYGTELGGVYAHQFPERVGRAVFDAVVDPTGTAEQGALAQTRGFQLAFRNFAADCVKRGEACKLPGGSVEEIEKFVGDLLARLDKKPVAGMGDRKLGQTQAINGIVQALYSKQYWPYLEQGIDEADGGQGALLLALSDSMTGRDQNGNYNNLQAANTAIGCVDDKARFSLEDAKAKLPEFREASPLFGPFLGWGLSGCSHWPVPGTRDHPDVSAKGAAPILVIGNTGDPATPYGGAKRMAEALGKGVGIEVTYRGEGHGAYTGGDACVRRTVNGYLLDGKVPRSGTVCP